MTQEQSTDIDTVDYRLGELSGKALAQTTPTLSDERVAAHGIQCFDQLKIGCGETPLSIVLSRPLFLSGHLAGYRNYLGGLI